MNTIAIIGNPNSGKTTLFNSLTGANQHVGNWPGVTVDRKSGHILHKDSRIELVDLPGIYSLSPYTQEELIAREYALSDEPDGILNIVDAAHLERNLYLTLQVIALGLPMVIALGFMDDCRAQGIQIDCDRLSALLGVPVIPISARRGENIDALKELLAGKLPAPKHQPAYLHGVGAAVRQVSELLAPLPLRKQSLAFYSMKVLEGDPHIRRLIPQEYVSKADAIGKSMESHDHNTGDREMIFADTLYDFIEEVVRQAETKPLEPKLTISERIDRIVMNKWLALPVFALVMLLMFWATFGPIGGLLGEILDGWITGSLTPLVRGALENAQAATWLVGLICDGVFAGVGSVVSFLPQIVILFLFLSLLEDTGYLARIAFIMDTLLRRIGLSGKSFVPMLMGFGCTTPAVMAARTMENEKDRRMTIMLTPFMSCGAKLPVYALLTGALFPAHQGLVTVSLYILGVIVAIFAGFLLKRTIFRGVSAGFVLELPTYRLPTVKGTLLNMWEKAKDFLTKAGTVIFVMSIVIWLLQSFTPTLQPAATSAESILGIIGIKLAPIFTPLGFGQWQASVSLLTGLVAKEAVVSTMSVLYGAGGDTARLGQLVGQVFTPLSGYSFLVFTLLYMPCMSAFATIRREMGGMKWALGTAVFQTIVAYAVAMLIYNIGGLVLSM